MAEGRQAAAAGVRWRAARVLDEVLSSRSPAEERLAAAEADLAERDRRLLRQLVLGTLRWLLRLDHVLEIASGRSLRRIRRPLLAPLRLGLYQLLFLDRVPAFAAVDRAVAESRRRAGGAAAGFVNAVLRKVAARPELDAWPVRARDPVIRLALETSHPPFLVRRWREHFGEATARELLAANNQPRPIWLLALGDRTGLGEELRQEGVETETSTLVARALRVVVGDPFDTGAFFRGAFYAQDEASQAAALVPPPRPAERILDAAAAPGGKSFTLAVADERVAMTCGDRSLARLRRLHDNQRRLRQVHPLVALDAAAPPFRPVFDRVVADLPCSGTGTLSRHPELKWRLSEREIDRLAGAGLKMLDGLVAALRPGGLLTVVTCSLEREENEGVVAELRHRRPELEPVELDSELPPAAAEHLFGVGAWRLLPTPTRDGFTVHVLRRRSRGRILTATSRRSRRSWAR